MSSQGQGVLEGETHGPRYAPQEQDDEAAGLVLNGSVSGEQRRSVSYGAVQRAEGVFTEAQRTGAASDMQDGVHNIHERATHAQHGQQATAAAEARPKAQSPAQGLPELPAATPVQQPTQAYYTF